MLNFQIADYCLLIWDGDNTKPDKAIAALQKALKIKEAGNAAITIFVSHPNNIDENEALDSMLQSLVSAKGCLQYDGYMRTDALDDLIHTSLALMLNTRCFKEVEDYLNCDFLPIDKENEHGHEQSAE